jgi:hypothetical protein
MAGASEYMTGSAPGGASFGAGNLAAQLFQMIGDLPQNYYQGQQSAFQQGQNQRTVQQQDLFKGGLPMGPDGQPDYAAMINKMIQSGGAPAAGPLLQQGFDLESQRRFYDTMEKLRQPQAGPNTSPSASLAAGSPQSIMAGSRPPVESSGRVWGDREAEAAGLYEPRGGRPPINSNSINQGNEQVGTGGGPVGGVGGSPISPAPTSGAGGGQFERRFTGAPGGDDLQRQIDHADNMATQYNTLAGAPRLPPAQAAAAKAEGERWANVAKQKREELAKNRELIPEEKLYRAGAKPGESLTTFEARRAGEKGAAEKEAANVGETMEKLALEGIEARGHVAQLDTIAKLGDRVGYGIVPKVQSFLGRYGVDTKGLSDIQAYERAVDYMAPQLRPIGSGRLMQQELTAFKSSLGGLMTTPEGRRISVDNLKLIAGYKQDIGKIAADQRIPIQQRMETIYSLPPPHLKTLDDMRGPAPAGGQGGGQAQPQIRDGMTATNPQTGQKIIMRGGQWIGMPAQ